MDKSLFEGVKASRETARPEEGKLILYSYGVNFPPHENYESRSTVMRDKMSDTEVHVTDEQP